MANKIGVALVFLALLSAFTGCGRRDEKTAGVEGNPPALVLPPDPVDAVPERLFTVVSRDIAIKAYFQYLKATAEAWDSLVPYPLSEHLLVRANPRIIDTLENTDYYRRKRRGDTLYMQPNAVVLHKGDTLFFPDSLSAYALLDRMKNTLIDVNIPEYRLRILEHGKTIYAFPIRVGKNRVRHLELAGHAVDLRTKPGTGSVIRLNRYPTFADPVTGKKFTHTRRDDKITTMMPQIPWVEVELNGQRYTTGKPGRNGLAKVEVELNGQRYGQMIHPTTNPETLEKAYSNGCVGMGEADAWRFYYHAPLGTAVVFRYDLEIIGVSGDTLLLPDIYKWGKKHTPLRAVFRALP